MDTTVQQPQIHPYQHHQRCSSNSLQTIPRRNGPRGLQATVQQVCNTCWNKKHRLPHKTTQANFLFLVFLAVIVRLVLMAMSIISATKFWSSWVPFVNVVRIVKVGEMPILISHNTLCSSRFLQHPIDSYHKKERRKQTDLMVPREEMLVLTQHLHFL